MKWHISDKSCSSNRSTFCLDCGGAGDPGGQLRPVPDRERLQGEDLGGLLGAVAARDHDLRAPRLVRDQAARVRRARVHRQRAAPLPAVCGGLGLVNKILLGPSIVKTS